MAILDRIFKKEENSWEFENPTEYENDCLSCRVLGSTALVSLGGYTYFSGMKQLREQRKIIERSKTKYKTGSRSLGILTLSLSLVGLGVYRMIN